MNSCLCFCLCAWVCVWLWLTVVYVFLHFIGQQIASAVVFSWNISYLVFYFAFDVQYITTYTYNAKSNIIFDNPPSIYLTRLAIFLTPTWYTFNWCSSWHPQTPADAPSFQLPWRSPVVVPTVVLVPGSALSGGVAVYGHSLPRRVCASLHSGQVWHTLHRPNCALNNLTLIIIFFLNNPVIWAMRVLW